MRKKIVLYSEAAYGLGLLILALGTALMERAGLGMSMVVAPAYLLHLWGSRHFPAFSFGMAEYVFQALLLIILSLWMRRFRLRYLFSFATAVIYSLLLDQAMLLTSGLRAESLPVRIGLYAGGLLLGSLGVALLFHTYLTPEAYELFVKEAAEKHGWRIDRVKTVYDCCSCLLGIAMSFAIFGFGRFEGIRPGTFLCALVNGWLIGRFSRLLEAAFRFRDGLPLRRFFSR